MPTPRADTPPGDGLSAAPTDGISTYGAPMSAADDLELAAAIDDALTGGLAERITIPSRGHRIRDRLRHRVGNYGGTMDNDRRRTPRPAFS